MRLRDSIGLQLIYNDATAFGSMVSNWNERELRARVEPVIGPAIAAQWRGVDHAQLRQAVMQPAVLGEYFHDARRLREEFLYPDPARVTPRRLLIHAGAQHTGGAVDLTPAMARELACWIGEFQRAAERPASAHGAALFDALAAAGAFTAEPAAPRLPSENAAGAPVTFVGHACVRAGSAATQVLIDPFLPVWPARVDPAYRPLTLSALAPDAVLITHSHPDHFDVGTLLRLGADCPIYVPAVERESALAIDMAARLRELGFRRVHTLHWHDSTRIGDLTVHALPFYGEQPGVGEVLHPEVRNQGNLYVVEGDGRRVAFTVDAGWDHAGDVRVQAARFRAEHGPVDLVFGGYRSWATFAAQLLRSSVRRYALFMPAPEWTRRHQLMTGPDEALDVAEAWGAHTLVPYADGGAPWYWELGLGPDLGSDAGARRTVDPHFDPPPELVAAAAARRSSWGPIAIASPVRVRVLRPGASLAGLDQAGGSVIEHEGHRWPYGSGGPAPRVPSGRPAELQTAAAFPAAAAGGAAAADECEVALARKKALLRILARSVAEQLGIAVGAQDAQQLSNTLRRRVGLTGREAMLRWLQQNGLSPAQFTELMTEWARCNALEQHFAAEIDRRLPGQLALHAMRHAAAAAAADLAEAA